MLGHGAAFLLKKDWLAAVAASLLFTGTQGEMFQDPNWAKTEVIYVFLYAAIDVRAAACRPADDDQRDLIFERFEPGGVGVGLENVVGGGWNRDHISFARNYFVCPLAVDWQAGQFSRNSTYT